MIETCRPSLEDIKGDQAWSAAEERLMKACGTGEMAWFGNERPTAGTNENTIRAGLIRHIMLGGCEDVPVHAKGVQIQGAWVTDELDLEACESPLDLFLAGCRICEVPVLRDARLGSVMLPGCLVTGLNAHRLKVTRGVLLNKKFKATGPVNLSAATIGRVLACDDGTFDGAGGVALNCNAMTVGASVFLKGGFTATGMVNLTGAQITGQLDCSDGTFNGAGGVALNCDALTVGADVFLKGGFTATGLVNLRGAQITGQLSCVGGTFDGAGGAALNCNAMTVGASVFLRGGFTAMGLVNLMRAQISGNLQCSGAKFQGNLDCEGVTVDSGMYWQDVKTAPKIFNLSDAHVGALRDDTGSWKECIPVLNGFRYDRMIGDISVTERLDWLAKKPEHKIKATVLSEGIPLPWARGVGKDKFDSQPYSQLAKVLREQGNASGSARVLVVREKLQRRAQYWRAQAGLDGQLSSGSNSMVTTIMRPIDGLFGFVFGYGHRPMRAFGAVFLIWLSCYWLYGAAYDAGQMAPNSDVVLTSVEWGKALEGCADVKKDGCEMPLHLWVGKGDLKPMPTSVDYETFSRGLYALDLFVPLDALGQENAWAPSKDRGWLGWWAYYLRWAVQMSGWVITAVAAAALTGVIGRKE